MKTCRDIARDIEMLQHRIRNSRVVEMTISLLENSDKKKCESPSSSNICIECNCWKLNHEIPVESKKTI